MCCIFFFFKQKTAYEMRISDWSSDVCSSDLGHETLMLGSRPVNSRAYVSRFNFNGADQQKKVGVLSGGERNRAHLAITLKKDANVLLLDEPTNDIDVNTLRALEEEIGRAHV